MPKEIAYQQGKTRTWESVREGLDFVWGQKALFGAMGLDMLAVLFGGAVALLPVFVQDVPCWATSIWLLIFGYLLGQFYSHLILDQVSSGKANKDPNLSGLSSVLGLVSSCLHCQNLSF
ncbi:MAG: hypothetical protein U0T36_02385 [Saprospiraceae bacterium]